MRTEIIQRMPECFDTFMESRCSQRFRRLMAPAVKLWEDTVNEPVPDRLLDTVRRLA